MAYSLQITSSCEEDLDKTIAYLVLELHNAEAARNLLGEIEKVYGILKENPFAFPACGYPLLNEYRKVLIKKYIVLYKVCENTVYVERFFHQLEDYAQKL